MWDVIAKLPQEDFTISAASVQSWVKGREEEQP